MQYKTIILSLLEQRPALYGQLCRQRTLLAALECHSLELKTRHEGWKDRLRRAKPDSDESQVSAEALEIALKELEELLPDSTTHKLVGWDGFAEAMEAGSANQ
jgi:hypothetical protein